MRNPGRLSTWAAGTSLLCALLGAAGAGCTRGGDCELLLDCQAGPTGGAGGAGGAGGQTASGGAGGGQGGASSGGQGGTGGSEPAHCSNDPTKQGSVANDCGVFVNPVASPGGAGTREDPVATLSDAAERIAKGGVPGRVF